MKFALAGLALAIHVLSVATALAGTSGIAVEHAWARATPRGAATAAAYVTLVNHGADDDRLLSVTSPVAERIQFHSETNDSGVMKMSQLTTVEIRSGATVVFTPGAMHMMLLGLKRQIKEGEAVPLTLTFEKAGAIDVAAPVGKIGAMTDPAAQANGD